MALRDKFADVSALPLPDELLMQDRVARILIVEEKTLETWRSRGGGPVYIKIGARLVRYRASDVQKFIDAGARASTSETTTRPKA